MELLYTDLVLSVETEELLLEKLRKWKKWMEVKGFRVNTGKTKVTRCPVLDLSGRGFNTWCFSTLKFSLTLFSLL